MICDECGELLKEGQKYCHHCGLEVLQSVETEQPFTDTGGEESFNRNIHEAYGMEGVEKAGGGFVCQRCITIFGDDNNGIVEQNSKERGFEQPGTNIVRFRSKQEYNWHMQNIHGEIISGKPRKVKKWGDRHTRGLGRTGRDNFEPKEK